MKIKQTAGKEGLGDFAKQFADLNDDVLFGEVWSNEDLSLKIRSILTISALVSKGLMDTSFQYHLQSAKKNGVTKKEMAAILTHLAFYAGWPNAWAAFRMAKEVYKEENLEEELHAFEKEIGFPVGKLNAQYAKFFIGDSYLEPLSKKVGLANVTFKPGTRNNWHIHHAKENGGQLLICIGGQGIYKEWGKPAILLKKGMVIEIPANVKHYHGATKDSYFAHLAMEIPGTEPSNEWLEEVNDEAYLKDNEEVLKEE